MRFEILSGLKVINNTSFKVQIYIFLCNQIKIGLLSTIFNKKTDFFYYVKKLKMYEVINTKLTQKGMKMDDFLYKFFYCKYFSQIFIPRSVNLL